MMNILTSVVLLICSISTLRLCQDHPTPRVYDKAHMHATAVRIRSKILKPYGYGTELINDMQSYIKELEDLIKGVSEENLEAKNAFDRLKNNGGPQHLQLQPVDTKPLVDLYKWDNSTTNMFLDLFDETLSHWNDLRAMRAFDEAATLVESGHFNQSRSSEFETSDSSSMESQT